MSEQPKSEQPQDLPEELPRIESAKLTDEDMENVSGGVAIQKGKDGYASARPS